MVEADSNLKLLPPSILVISKVFERIDILFTGIQKCYLAQILGFWVTYVEWK